MEIRRGYGGNVTFLVPNDLEAATFTVQKDGEQLGPTSDATIASGKATCALPYAAYVDEGEVIVTLRFNYQSTLYVPSKTVQVITPYLELDEIKAVVPTASDAEAWELEAQVRHMIDAHTGQNFGITKDKSYTVEGHGEFALRLPKRLIRLTSLSTLTATLDPNNSIIVSDGWYLKKGWSGDVIYHDTDSTYWLGADVRNNAAPGEPGFEKSSHGPVIYAPGTGPQPSQWKDDYPFTITGDWGYDEVPLSVKDAAKLLANDYACNEALYRDRYLESIKAADWRLQFDARAWFSTGNARADFLLSEYVILDWAVI